MEVCIIIQHRIIKKGFSALYLRMAENGSSAVAEEIVRVMCIEARLITLLYCSQYSPQVFMVNDL